MGLSIFNENEHELFFMPGNGATSRLGKNINIPDYNELSLWAKTNNLFVKILPARSAGTFVFAC